MLKHICYFKYLYTYKREIGKNRFDCVDVFCCSTCLKYKEVRKPSYTGVRLNA